MCARGSEEPVHLMPNVSFASISGGRDYFCGITETRTGDLNSMFCWTTNQNDTQQKRIYTGQTPLDQVSVGITHVSAVQNETTIDFWRPRGFHNPVHGKYSSLTSGKDFTCAIGSDDTVSCWGSPTGNNVMKSFSNLKMSTIVAGTSHVCGIRTNGSLVCHGNDDNLHLDSGNEIFSQLAVGENYVCGILNTNQTVVCWGNGVVRHSPVGNESLVLIVAGGNLTCGLLSRNLTITCWLPTTTSTHQELSLTPTALQSLPHFLPGFCKPSNHSCECAIFPNSETLCSGTGVICKPCMRNDTTQSPQESSQGGGRSRWFLPFVIVGSVGSFMGICTFVYWMVTKFCKREKVHNSVQPTIAGGSTNSSQKKRSTPNSRSPSLVRSVSNSIFLSNSLKLISKSSSIFRRIDRQKSGSSSTMDRNKEFTFEELSKATNQFALSAKIGQGSFGTVYKGKLSDGREVAIKRSDAGIKGKRPIEEKENAFISELELFSRIHHKHLVGFIGFCKEEHEMLLVYEYMKNESLFNHLHGTPAITDDDAEILKSWKTRIKILLDVARGIDYLHNYAVPPIIHRDIKSSNILLDRNWTAKVSDFGLSLSESGSDSEGTHPSIKTAGTLGYMDPEYYGLNHLTTKSDVYGFGVVMLEVLTGKKAIFKDEGRIPISVVEYVEEKMKGGRGKVEDVLDERVRVSKRENMEAIELVANTAMFCVRLEGIERPNIGDVMNNLEIAFAQFEQTPSHHHVVDIADDDITFR